MTEYWVSQAKYYCKYCKIWMYDNKATRTKHDTDERHLANIQKFHNQKKQEKLHGAKSEKELQQQLANIESAAKAALAHDIATDALRGGNSSNNNKKTDDEFVAAKYLTHDDKVDAVNAAVIEEFAQKPVVAPSHTISLDGLSEAALKLIADNHRESMAKESGGTYTVRGITYVEGQFNETMLVEGINCEIFFEELDEWVPGSITKVRFEPIPDSKLTRKLFDVKYTFKDTENSGLGVTSDRIRLVYGAKKLPKNVVPSKVESSGLGKWSTVSVRVVNEEEEEKERQKRLKEEEEERKAKQKADKIKEALENHPKGFDYGKDSALSSYDPYNTGFYKGIKIDNESTTNEIESISNGQEVSFKKKKSSNGNSNNSTRKVRQKLDD